MYPTKGSHTDTCIIACLPEGVRGVWGSPRSLDESPLCVLLTQLVSDLPHLLLCTLLILRLLIGWHHVNQLQVVICETTRSGGLLYLVYWATYVDPSLVPRPPQTYIAALEPKLRFRSGEAWGRGYVDPTWTRSASVGLARQTMLHCTCKCTCSCMQIKVHVYRISAWEEQELWVSGDIKMVALEMHTGLLKWFNKASLT